MHQKEAKKFLLTIKPFDKLIPTLDLNQFEKQSSVFHELVSAIIFQQISFKAAENIYKRMLDKLSGPKYTIDTLLACSFDELRACGLSKQKVSYSKNIAEFFLEKNLQKMDWSKLSDDEIIKLLTQIKGVGEWTVQMLLIFYLERPDVFPAKDLAIQMSMKSIFGLREEKKELLKKMEEIAEEWRPYRTIASKYLWAWKRVN